MCQLASLLGADSGNKEERVRDVRHCIMVTTIYKYNDCCIVDVYMAIDVCACIYTNLSREPVLKGKAQYS
jgi:hypothetical protein